MNIPKNNIKDTDVLLEKMGVSDIDSVHAEGKTFTIAALRNLVYQSSNKPDLIVFRSDRLVSDYDNPNLLPGMFPTLFPYGLGGFDIRTRQATLSFESQANYYLDIADRQFRYHNSFLFVVMNIIQRHQTQMHTHFVVRNSRFDAVAVEIDNIDPATIRRVASHLESHRPISELTANEKRVFTLLREVNTIAGKVTGSQASKIRHHNEIRAYVGRFGVPQLFFTANPSAQNSPMFQLMWGDENIDLACRYPILADYKTRCLRLAQDPVAALDFFNRIMRITFTCLFGWDFDKGMSTIEGGVLGHLEAFYGVDELTERGSYHRHTLIFLKGGLNPLELHERLDRKDDFTTRFFSYIDGIIEHHLPSDDIHFDARGNPKAECPPQIPSADAQKSELDLFMLEIEQDLKYVGEILQRHVHRPVCFKYDHKTCRFLFPHELVDTSHYDEETRSVVLRCLDSYVNYLNRFILIMCRFNHDLKCILSGRACKSAMIYITEYITKLTLNTHEMLSLLSEGVSAAQQLVPAGSPKFRAQVVMQKCLTQFAKSQQVHAQHAARILRNQEEVFRSHRTVPMSSGGLMRYVQAHWPYKLVEDDTEQEGEYIRMQLDASGKLRRLSQVDDYLHRALDLHNVSFYEFVLRFQIVAVTKNRKNEIEHFVKGTRTDKYKRYQFLSFYERHGKYEIAESVSREDSMYWTKVVPRIVAYRLPRASNNDFAAFMVAHFVPFNLFNNLRPDGVTFEQMLLTEKFSTESRTCMKNWEAMHECEDERDRERMKKREASMRESLMMTNALNSNSAEQFIETINNDTTQKRCENNIQKEVLDIIGSNWLSPLPPALYEYNSNYNRSLHFNVHIDKQLIALWKAQVKAIESSITSKRINSSDLNRQIDTRAEKHVTVKNTLTAADISDSNNLRTQSGDDNKFVAVQWTQARNTTNPARTIDQILNEIIHTRKLNESTLR